MTDGCRRAARLGAAGRRPESGRDRALGMGGPDRVERQHSLGKLTVRERLDLLLDPGTWVEYGLLADHMDPASATGTSPPTGW